MKTGETQALPVPARKPARPWWFHASIGAGMILVIALAVALLWPRGDEDQAQVAQAPADSASFEQQLGLSAAQLAAMRQPTESTEPAPEPEAAAMVPANEAPVETSPEPEMTPEPVAAATPETDPAPVARRELLDRQRAAEAKYAAAMEPVEEKIIAWDFTAARQAAEGVDFDEPELRTRLETRRNEIQRMEVLKKRIIAKISEAEPALKKSDLKIRGVGGQITDVGPAGITTKTITGKVERLAWNDLGSQAAGKLMELVVDPSNGDDCVTAGMLAFVSGDRTAAERFFEQAQKAGTNVSAQLAAMAAARLAQASDLLSQDEFAQAASLLDNLETKYADLAWLTANRATIDAAITTARRGVREEEADALYAEAVKLHQEETLFDLRDAVERLKNEYADCRPVIEAGRTPALADFEQAVAELGTRLTVRLDGKGDFTSIQAAIDAAGPNSLIEIWDNGPYLQKLIVNKEKAGLTIRGAVGCWPIITSQSVAGESSPLIQVLGINTTLERALVVNTDLAGRTPTGIHINVGSKLHRGFTLHHCLVSMPGGLAIQGDFYDTLSVVECLILFRSAVDRTAAVENSIFIDGLSSHRASQVDSSVILKNLALRHHPTQVSNSIIQDVTIDPQYPDHKVDYCGIVGEAKVTLGEHCIIANPLFRDPANLDFRLMPGSPCIGAASDGGDIGVRYTPEMMELCRIALELRAKGIIKF